MKNTLVDVIANTLGADRNEIQGNLDRVLSTEYDDDYFYYER